MVCAKCEKKLTRVAASDPYVSVQRCSTIHKSQRQLTRSPDITFPHLPNSAIETLRASSNLSPPVLPLLAQQVPLHPHQQQVPRDPLRPTSSSPRRIATIL
ncbi:hypothetical protein BCV69DRAFT_282096 [Microstroma glucosiphilum]|uniref:Uncharacterized protein n=1 Tax=Pseudomicrostroma glucosiphilum TaxID=1684307 RepID=A0A316UA59_9BASI|nr:hypothetical protein BCV69DRAFT_282096 [Pseudomicrostroma glucosiphilum]PWN21361.1 hypothetical protein BCV69DRAFT_282096 [Pseudomicrostroma glucosiphilum]